MHHFIELYMHTKNLSVKILALFLVLFLISCKTIKIKLPDNQLNLTGQKFYQNVFSTKLSQRESELIDFVFSGAVPDFFRKFKAIELSIPDPHSGKEIIGTLYVAPDYLSVGTNEDWARVPLSPMTAQLIADSLGCFLPTRKIVDEIYKAAEVRLSPVPMYAFRDSAITFWQHHLIVEGQRKGRKGLIAGIKKDIVISAKVSSHPSPNRVAIYGWHQLDGKPIQPLYAGHVNSYVDYSHGTRLVWRKIRVKLPEKARMIWMDYTELLSDPRLRSLICDEDDCGFARYETDL